MGSYDNLCFCEYGLGVCQALMDIGNLYIEWWKLESEMTM